MADIISRIQAHLEMDVLEKHECAQKLLNDYYVLRVIDNLEGEQTSHWVFINCWVAGEAAVRDGEAEKIGEIMSISTVKINFCPFCGWRCVKSNAIDM